MDSVLQVSIEILLALMLFINQILIEVQLIVSITLQLPFTPAHTVLWEIGEVVAVLGVCLILSQCI